MSKKLLLWLKLDTTDGVKLVAGVLVYARFWAFGILLYIGKWRA
jgi:hypothetical protein